MKPTGILIFFHCGSNNKYSIAWWEEAFAEMGSRFTGDIQRVHFAYTSLADGVPEGLGVGNVIRFDSRDSDGTRLQFIRDYVEDNRIQLAFGFDQPVRRPGHRALRAGGVRRILSYWGAPISGPSPVWKLLLRRLEVRTARHQPDRYLFQSQAMVETAIHGRGIHPSRVRLCRSGVDHLRYSPGDGASDHAYSVFGIPRDRRIAFYSGHLSERKGIDLIMESARILVAEEGRTDIHFLLTGEDWAAETYLPLVRHTPAEGHVTFAGYRDDIAEILRSVYVGLRPTKDWDSFPVSCMEAASSGVPLIVSDVGGLPEVVVDGLTGRVIPAGSGHALTEALREVLNNEVRRDEWARASRERVLGELTRDQFLDRLTGLVEEVWKE